MGYNANVGIDSVVKFQGLWFYFEVFHAWDIGLFHPLFFCYTIIGETNREGQTKAKKQTTCMNQKKGES
jgi:hypothetical protein